MIAEQRVVQHRMFHENHHAFLLSMFFVIAKIPMNNCFKNDDTAISHLTSCTNGGKTVASRTFLMTSTVNGGLYQVKRWLAGSWIVLDGKKGLAQHLTTAHRNDFRDRTASFSLYQVILWLELVSIFISRANELCVCLWGVVSKHAGTKTRDTSVL